MPSVLVELGFITNKSDRNTLASKDKRTQLASRLLGAFKEFKDQYEGGEAESLPDAAPAPASKPQAAPEPAAADAKPTASNVESEAKVPVAGEAFYAIQIFAVSRNIASGSSDFKGLKEIGKYKAGSLYKYTTGHYKTAQQAQQQLSAVRAKFKDAFVVKIDGQTVEKLK